MRLFLAINLLWCSYGYANIGLPYHPETDAICFKNADPEIAHVGIPILGKLGVKEGICQGIAGVTAAFLENARFEPGQDSTIQDPHRLVLQLLEYHRFGLHDKVVINGAKNLKDFCNKNKREIMRASILYNSEIAVSKILVNLPDLYHYQKNELLQKSDQVLLLQHLRSIEETLKNGRYPLMLYFKHVVMVTGLRERSLTSGAWVIELSFNDSNHPDVMTSQVFDLGMDGIPTSKNHMIWNLN